MAGTRGVGSLQRLRVHFAFWDSPILTHLHSSIWCCCCTALHTSWLKGFIRDDLMTCEQRFQLACESKQEEVIHGRNTINDVKDLTADNVEDLTADDVEDHSGERVEEASHWWRVEWPGHQYPSQLEFDPASALDANHPLSQLLPRYATRGRLCDARSQRVFPGEHALEETRDRL